MKSEVSSTTATEEPTATHLNEIEDDLPQRCKDIISIFKDQKENYNITASLISYRQILKHYKDPTSKLYDKTDRDFIVNQFLEESCMALFHRECDHAGCDYNLADLIRECCHTLILLSNIHRQPLIS